MLDDEIIGAIRERQSTRASIAAKAKLLVAQQDESRSPVRLPVLREPVAVEDVRAAEDRFRCERLACIVSADACVERQLLANHAARPKRHRTVKDIGEICAGIQMPSCRRCGDGRDIAEALGVEIVETTGDKRVDAERFRGARWPARRDRWA